MDQNMVWKFSQIKNKTKYSMRLFSADVDTHENI